MTHDKIVVFITDAAAGYNDSPDNGYVHTEPAVRALADQGIKIHSVLCGTHPWTEAQLRWYAEISGGNFIESPKRIVSGVTREPTWIVKLTAITPFGSFRLKRASSPPTKKIDYYNFSIYVDFFAKAVPWHEFFVTELAANLEKAELRPYILPPEQPPEMPPELIPTPENPK